MPVSFPQSVWDSNVVVDLLLKLCWQLGLPFLLLSATATLAQSFFVLRAEKKDANPYPIYAWSNIGSLAGLLAFPLALEVLFSLEQNWLLWRALFGVYCLTLVYLAFKPHRAPDAAQEPPAAGARWAWFLLPAASGVMLITASNYIALSSASVPLMWMLPLALYLSTFIIYFWGDGLLTTYTLHAAAGISLLAAAAIQFLSPIGEMSAFVGAVFLLFYGCLAYHRALYDARPGPELLSEYFLLIAAGGFCGTLVAALVLPMVANYFLAGMSDFTVLAVLAAYGLDLMLARRWRFFRYGLSAVLAAAVLVSVFVQRPYGQVHAVRTFYGYYVVADFEKQNIRVLSNGAVSHSEQYLDEKRWRDPLGYYGPTSPVSDIFLIRDPGVVGVVGLGAGALACYSKKNSVWAFFELDKEVARLAQTYFTFLPDSPADNFLIVGDARKKLALVPSGFFDLLILDAFSSGSVPTHLLTAEAARLYASKLGPGGIVIAHVSNNFFDLYRVLAPAFESSGLRVLVKYGHCRGLKPGDYCNSSDWLAATADGSLAAQLEDLGWEALPTGYRRVLWTDGKRNIFKALRRI